MSVVRRQDDLPEDERLGAGEGDRRIRGSIFGDLFDLISRPARASAGAAFAATDDDPETSIVEGLMAGLKGRSDKSYSDVLGNLGVENRTARAVGGLAGDVLLDPLTFTGVKFKGGTSKAKAEIQGIKKLTEAGEELTESAIQAERDSIRKLDPAHAYVTFMGKKITPNITQPSAVGNKMKDLLVGEEGSRRLGARAFSKRSELPFGLADTARVYESRNAGLFRPHHDALLDYYRRLTPDEQRRVSLAIESGEDLSTVNLINDKAKINGHTTLEDYKRTAQEHLKQFFDDEMKLGLYEPGQFNPNYIYKFFQNKKGLERMPGLPSGAPVHRGTPFEDLKKMYSLQDAEKAGLDPVVQIGEIMALRSEKHYRTMARQGIVRDAIEEFGVAPTEKQMQSLRDMKWLRAEGAINAPIVRAHADLQDKWLPRPIVEALNGMESVLKDGSASADFMRFYDGVLNQWKKLNTSYNPGYHVRNSFSDGLINYMDGVVNPSLYKRSVQVLRAKRNTDVDDVLGVAVNPVQRNMQKIRVGKHNQIPVAQMWDLYLRGGSKSGFIVSEVQKGAGPLAREGMGKYVAKSRSKLGQFDTKVNNFADEREDLFRVAHHIKAMEDELPKNRMATQQELQEASLRAGERVRKYNIDYGMLSSFEHKTMRRIVPFYGWMRRNLPLQMELLFTKPGYMAAYPKGQDLLQGVLGTDDGEGDWLIPKWIRDSAPVRLALADNEKNTAVGKLIKKLSGAGEGEAVFTNIVSSQTPIGDLENILDPLAEGIESGNPFETVQGLAHKAVNMATPVAKIPTELATGRSLFTGQPIDESGGWTNWLASQLGPSRMASNAVEGDTRFLTSWAAGAQLQPVTQERQAGEFRRREDVLRAMINEEKNDAFNAAGIDNPSPRLYEKYRNLDIAKLDRYLRNTRRIVRAANPADTSI